MNYFYIICLIGINSITGYGQTYPTFGPEIDVTINGLSFDAMEPFISSTGDVLFFNNLNDGIDTKLFYATRVNDSTFNFIGEINGTNQITQPHLDAVADMDSLNNFYWTSTRNYPAETDNLFHGNYLSGNVSSIGRVHGNFNKGIAGWLVMDHGISTDGQYLYYNNARFDGVCQGPCETEIGIAQKINDSTFNQIANSSTILQNINDTNYIYYAPCITSDELELYYTRYLKGPITTSTSLEICVAVRTAPMDNFSLPIVLFSETVSDLIEAPTLTLDKQIMYYHRKVVGSHKIVMRYRENPLSQQPIHKSIPISVYPNPTNGFLSVNTHASYEEIKLSVFNLIGEEQLIAKGQKQIDLNALPNGTYLLKIELDGSITTKKFTKSDY